MVTIKVEDSKHSVSLAGFPSLPSLFDSGRLAAQEDLNSVVEQAGEGRLSEAVAVRNADKRLLEQQIIFYTYPEATEWRFGDLWKKHPTKENLWKYAGRLDDMIVLDSGHNFHPSQYERGVVASDSRVRACLIVGNGRPDLAVILELEADVTSGSPLDLQETLWPVVQRVNARSNKQAQIPGTNLIFTDQHRPLPRTAKGSIARSKAESLFREEINRVYRS